MVDDKALIQGCKKGDLVSQKLLYTKFSPMLMGICLRYAKNQMEAEDILQDSFVKIFIKMDTIRQESSLEAWLKQITVNTAINAYKKKTNEGFSVDIDEIQEAVADPKIPVSDALTHQLLLGFINELPAGYRMAFNMYEIDGYSHKEIAEMLGCSPVTVRSQLFKAKEQLRKKIEQHLNNKFEIL